MARWSTVQSDRCQFAVPLSHEPCPDGTTGAAAGPVFLFAGEHNKQDLLLCLDLESDEATDHPPELQVQGAVGHVEFPHDERPQASSGFRVHLVVPAAPWPIVQEKEVPPEDDELTFVLSGASPGGPPACRIVLRRTSCRIRTTMIDRHKAVPLRPETRAALPVYQETSMVSIQGQPLWSQTRAALLWYSWKRYQEVVALKRFTNGLGGSDVLVFRPRLCEPDAVRDIVQEAGRPQVVSRAWGSCLLVKTGKQENVRREWDRFQTFLMDRLHPFMARSEACLTIRAAGAAPPEKPQATIIGSFLGGDLLNVEPFEQLVQGASDLEQCRQVVTRLFSVLATWYDGDNIHPLREWRHMFGPLQDGRLLLGNEYDLTTAKDRQAYAGDLAWDIPFRKEEHLHRHWLGKNRSGLLYRLLDMPVRYSLVHGDLHLRNILADRANVWLLDFGVTGVGPTLFDFAKLEIYLRLWGLDVGAGGENFEEAVFQLETQLLDRMTGTEGGLESVRATAAGLGARPDDLRKIANCILEVRRQALPYSIGGPDRSDYLAVLFLTAVTTLRFAGSGSAPPANFRWLMELAWVLEDTLSRLCDLEPFPRERASLDPRQLLTRQWLEAPRAPERVTYFLEREDGRRALQPLAATRGVLQNARHHLDVFDHTLLVLAYLEALLADREGYPLAGFLDPDGVDRQVEADLVQQGIRFPPISRIAAPAGGKVERSAWQDKVQALLQSLSPEDRLLLKWTVLFHDVGKPATRGLNPGNASRGDRVQFLGHEIYGRQLVAGHLARLYPEPELRDRIDSLLDRHHVHHQLVNRYLREKPKALDVIRAGTAGKPLAEEFEFLKDFWGGPKNPHAQDFPLLILHGYADALACRGPETHTSLSQVAEVDLLLLRMFLEYPSYRQAQDHEKQCKDLTKGFDQELSLSGRQLGRVLQEVITWCKEERTRRAAAGLSGPTREELLAKAREIAARLKGAESPS